MAGDILDGIGGEMFAADTGSTVDVTLPVTSQPAEVPQPAAPAPAPQDSSQPRQADGKFAPKEPAPAAPPAPQPVDQKPKVDPEQFKGYLDERDKRKALERELQELKSRQTVAPAPVPSIQTDPEAFAEYQQHLVQQTRTNTIFDVSETMAREKHGDDAVASAMEWALQRAEQSPAFAAEYIKQKHPIDWAVKQQKRDTTLNEIGDDADAYVRRRAAELGLIVGAAPPSQAVAPIPAAIPQPAPTAQPAPAPLPRSIASAQAAGSGVGAVTTGEFAALDLVHKT